MMFVWVFVFIAVALAMARIVTRQLPSSPSNQDRILAQQAERIEQLEDELRQVREQADFTERLLTERSDSASEDDLEEK